MLEHRKVGLMILTEFNRMYYALAFSETDRHIYEIYDDILEREIFQVLSFSFQ